MSKSAGISDQTQPKSWEKATSSKRACQKWRTSFLKNESRLHTITESSERVRARAANCRRLSVPFQANPIIRNETASFYGLVQAYLFIRYARTKGVGVEMYRGLAVPLPLLILLVEGVQGMAEYTFEPHVRFPLFSNLTVLFVFSCSCTQVPRSFSLFISFMRNLDDAHVFENMNPSFRVYEDTQLEILRIIFRSVEK